MRSYVFLFKLLVLCRSSRRCVPSSVSSFSTLFLTELSYGRQGPRVSTAEGAVREEVATGSVVTQRLRFDVINVQTWLVRGRLEVQVEPSSSPSSRVRLLVQEQIDIYRLIHFRWKFCLWTEKKSTHLWWYRTSFRWVLFQVASQLILQVCEFRGGEAVLRGQWLRFPWAWAAKAGEGQGEETLLLLEAMFLYLSIQTVPLLLGHATKLYRWGEGRMSWDYL